MVDRARRRLAVDVETEGARRATPAWTVAPTITGPCWTCSRTPASGPSCRRRSRRRCRGRANWRTPRPTWSGVRARGRSGVRAPSTRRSVRVQRHGLDSLEFGRDEFITTMVEIPAGARSRPSRTVWPFSADSTASKTTLLVPSRRREERGPPAVRSSTSRRRAGRTDHPARAARRVSEPQHAYPGRRRRNVLSDSATLVVGRSNRPLAKIAANGTAAPSAPSPIVPRRPGAPETGLA